MKGFMGGWSSGRAGAAEPPEVMEALVQRVRTLRASIESSEGCAESTAAVLGSYAQRLADIDAAMRPIQVVSRPVPISASSRRFLEFLQRQPRELAVSDFGPLLAGGGGGCR
jgi:uncharacterized protein